MSQIGRSPRIARRSPGPRIVASRMPGVGQAQLAVLRLQALEHEVDVAELADVLADHEDARVAREVRVEVAQQHLPAVDHRRRVRVLGGTTGTFSGESLRARCRGASCTARDSRVRYSSTNRASSSRAGDSSPRSWSSAREPRSTSPCDRVTFELSARLPAMLGDLGHSGLRRGSRPRRSRSSRIGDWNASHARSRAASTASLSAASQPSSCDSLAIPELDHPVAHPRDAVELVLELQPLLRLVALVAAARRVALRLRHLDHVEERRLVLPRARARRRSAYRLDQAPGSPSPRTTWMSMPGRSSGMKPRSTSEIEALVVARP